MSIYQVNLCRSYLVKVEAESEEKAKDIAEHYTSHISDLSNDRDRRLENFSIIEIECNMNEALEAEEVDETKE